MRRPTRDGEAFYDVGEAGVEPAGPLTLDLRPTPHGCNAGNGVARDSPILRVATGETSSRLENHYPSSLAAMYRQRHAEDVPCSSN